MDQDRFPQGWKPSAIVNGVGVSGGCLRKPMFVPVELFQGKQFVKLCKRENWLCHAVSGKAHQLKPLLRTTLIEHLSMKVAGLETEAVHRTCEDKMSDLGLDGEAVGVAASKNSKKKAPVKKGIVEVSVSPRLRGDGIHVVECLAGHLRKGAGVMVNVESVPWAIARLAEEMQSGGIDFQPDETLLSEPFFANRDRAWVARARAPDGEVLRKTLAVPLFTADGPKKRPLSPEEFDEAKRARLEEIRSWQSQVSAGGVERAGRGRPWSDA